jgi:hypothetical protein
MNYPRLVRDHTRQRAIFAAKSQMIDREGIKLRFRFTGLAWKPYDLDLGLGEAKR